MSTARATCLTRRPGCDKVTDGSGRVRAAHPSPTHHRRVTIGDFSEPTSVTPGPRPSTTQHIASYLGSVDDPIIARSALKHGLSEADILHAYHHPIRAWDMGDGFTMLLGANQAALVLEIGYIQGITAIVIVHAMRAREKFLR